MGRWARGGNVVEWDETELDLVNNSSSSARGIRGGSWVSDSNELRSSVRGGNLPANEISNFGFRVASIPESSPAAFGALATVGVLLWRRMAR